MISYRFILDDGRTIEFNVDLDRPGACSSGFEDAPEWTRLEFNQCPNCPLKIGEKSLCPVAKDIRDVTERFSEIVSFERATVEVITPDRTYLKKCDVQTGLRSLLGLIMATSACPVLSQFKGLSYFHLPFATLEENLFRTVSAYLLKQYFAYKEGFSPDLDLIGLSNFYEGLQSVNRYLKKRMDAASKQDANLNAVGTLVLISASVNDALETRLSDLHKKFFPAVVGEFQEGWNKS